MPKAQVFLIHVQQTVLEIQKKSFVMKEQNLTLKVLMPNQKLLVSG
jgi:hypothetical protein